MTQPAFPPWVVLAASVMGGLLLALAAHILVGRLGLDLGGLWSGSDANPVPIDAAIAWWLTAAAAFVSGNIAARLMAGAISGRMPPRLKQLLIGIGVLTLAAAGQLASAPGSGPTLSGVLSGITALALGAVMAFIGAQLALRPS